MATAIIGLPSRDTLEQRLARQGDRVLSAHGICVLATRMAWEGESGGGFDADDLVALRSALEGLGELLESIKETIEPEEILAAEPAEVAS